MHAYICECVCVLCVWYVCVCVCVNVFCEILSYCYFKIKSALQAI